jgi:hypothetical protein
MSSRDNFFAFLSGPPSFALGFSAHSARSSFKFISLAGCSVRRSCSRANTGIRAKKLEKSLATCSCTDCFVVFCLLEETSALIVYRILALLAFNVSEITHHDQPLYSRE